MLTVLIAATSPEMRIAYPFPYRIPLCTFSPTFLQMPTVIMVDTSLEMATPYCELDYASCDAADDDANADGEGPEHRNEVIVQTVTALIDKITSIVKIEFISLVLFNSDVEGKVDFTRDYPSIIEYLTENLDFQSIKNIDFALSETVKDVEKHWGQSTPYQIILLTNELPESYETIHKLPNGNRLITLLINEHNPNICGNPGETLKDSGIQETNSFNGEITSFFCQLDRKTKFEIGALDTLSRKMIEYFYIAYDATLKCGHLKSNVQLFPSPLDYEKEGDFSICRLRFPEIISIFGFLKLSDVSSPPFISRHLILPKTESDAIDPDKPSFTVLLHGALKVKSNAALVQLQLVAGRKRRSDKLPWLGNLNMLSIQSDFATPPYQTTDDKAISPFPVKPTTRHSYSQNYVVWVRSAGIQTDIQKILRNARKLPEKMVHFYKELNRLRKAILSYSFHELFDMVGQLIERELQNLPTTSHPDAARHLAYAVEQLKNPHYHDYNNNISPLQI